MTSFYPFQSDARRSFAETVDLTERYLLDDSPYKVPVFSAPRLPPDLHQTIIPLAQKVSTIFAHDESRNKEDVPILGDHQFRKSATKLLFGLHRSALGSQKIISIQTPTGKLALRITAEFLSQELGIRKFYYCLIGEPYHTVFKSSGFEESRIMTYWNVNHFDYDGFVRDLKEAASGSAIILHSCGFNVSGCDPSKQQWLEIVHLIREKRLFPILDVALQGLASGDLDEDAWVVRLFYDIGLEFIVCQSFVSHFGLNLEPVGNIIVVLEDEAKVPAIEYCFEQIVLSFYGRLQMHGANVISFVLNNEEYRRQWLYNLKLISNRTMEMKKRLRCTLELLGTPGNWSVYTNQVGLFLYSGLNPEQCAELCNRHHIYVYSSGRFNMCEVNEGNVEYIGKAIDDIIKNVF